VFILSLPLTLAIIEGLHVKVNDDSFIIPHVLVEECVELGRNNSGTNRGIHLIKVRNEMVPYISVREKFDIEGEHPQVEQIIILNESGMRVGLVVDKVIGEHQTVIKNLGPVFKNADYVSGANILGDGSVALILEPAKIIQSEVLKMQNN
jgi:two-component system chemotaxis sensor kinase CheA